MVIDASVSIAAFVREGHSARAQSIFETVARDGAVVPGLWPLEVAQVLLVLERRNVIDSARRIEIVGEFAALPIKVDSETAQRAWSGISGVAERHRLTVYNATYLELAVRLSLPH